MNDFEVETRRIMRWVKNNDIYVNNRSFMQKMITPAINWDYIMDDDDIVA